MLDEFTLASAGTCSVEAPAGCGKTELIVRTLKVSPANKRYLVLTHTHAGVRALRQRLRKHQVSASRARIETIASWCLDFATHYPQTTSCQTRTPTDSEWEAVYSGMSKLLQIPAIQRVVKATYAGVFIDEYQDCTEEQHSIATKLAAVVPCRVLGDPLQAIFHFRGTKVGWKSHVEKSFPPLGVLGTPHRWRKRNEDLGEWLLKIRNPLKNGQPIDLRGAPVTWLQNSAQNQVKAAKECLGLEGDVIAIRKRKPAAHDFASRCKGYSSMEEVECKSLLEFAEKLDAVTGPERAIAVIKFADDCAVGIKSFLAREVEKLQGGKALIPSRSKNVHRVAVASALDEVVHSTDLAAVEGALHLLFRIPGVRPYRRELMYAAKDAFQAWCTGKYASMKDAAWMSRNQARHFDRKMPRRLVSRTLLVKGLEFSHSLIVDAADFSDDDGAQNFYVAATRGSMSLTILSKEPILQFRVPDL